MFKLELHEIQEGKADSIRRAIERAILEDRLKPGEALPTVRTLAMDLGINKNTVVVAYRQLQQSGLVVSEGRRGSVVATQASRDRATSADFSLQQTISVRDGNPDIAFLPSEIDLREAMAKMNLDNHLYGEQRNHLAFVKWAAECFAADGLDSKQGVFVSAGALDLVERALIVAGLMPGDKVAVEDPGYMSLLALTRSMGFELVPLELDEQGVKPASLKNALDAGVKAVLVSSRAQNPTGITTSSARAKDLSMLVASTTEVLFIDDDHSSLLELAPYYPWHVNESGRWLTVRSLSKFLGPDYRLAVTTGDPMTVQRLERRQAVGMGWVSTFVQRLALQLLNSSSVQRKIAEGGTAYRERYEALLAALKKKQFNVMGCVGLNVWVPIANERAVAERLFDAGWLVRPGRDFCITEQSGIRVTSSRMTPQQSLAFIKALVAARDMTETTRSA
ncbi:aminotransferase class I/II-fold pyridoxal phosphate-dependent enzyme [Pseudomonas sp. NA-150]|uniref:aminotransferase class I/II-fold pyridoxal phosphate-dependent enzyme n=1 Tax=Pseudomonas sp. NA-150 TaxID=3367525 RepID=UPI0037CBAAD7